MSVKHVYQYDGRYFALQYRKQMGGMAPKVPNFYEILFYWVANKMCLFVFYAKFQEICKNITRQTKCIAANVQY